MSGFLNVGQFAEADEAGQSWLTQFRKTVSSGATATNGWIDYSYFSGSPVANFYASSPLTAAVLDSDKGILVPTVTPALQHLSRFTVMTANTGSTANARQSLILLDYLMFYPFIDTDAAGELQACINYNPVLRPSLPTLPRYTSGYVMAVGQAASTTIGTFEFTYTNQSGVAGRVSPPCRTFAISGGGQLVSAEGAGASFQPFLPLAAGDSGVQKIESVTFTVGGGGLMALVIVKPLLYFTATQECRTTGGAAFGAADEWIALLHGPSPRIKNGAIVNIIGQGSQGSLATSQLIGTVETCWN